MADTKISALTALTGANTDSANDVYPIVDTSVTTTKKQTRSQLFDISDAAGGQIIFPATQNPSANANCLDDYAEQTTTPTATSTVGTITTQSTSINTQKIGNRVFFDASISVTNNGTGSGAINVTFPYTAASASSGGGRESAVGGKGLGWSIGASSNVIGIQNYDNTYPASNGCVLLISGSIKV